MLTTDSKAGVGRDEDDGDSGGHPCGPTRIGDDTRSTLITLSWSKSDPICPISEENVKSGKASSGQETEDGAERVEHMRVGEESFGRSKEMGAWWCE